MSKVKGEIFDLNKTKLRGNLRRVETKKKKNERLRRARANEYGSMRGWCVRDCKYVGEYVLVTIPEHYQETYHFERKEFTIYDENGVPYTYSVPIKVVDGQKFVPAKTRKKKVHSEYVDIEPRPIRINTNLKKYRKMAERKMRNTPIDELYNGGLYKKVFDVAWSYI